MGGECFVDAWIGLGVWVSAGVGYAVDRELEGEESQRSSQPSSWADGGLAKQWARRRKVFDFDELGDGWL